MSLLVGVGRPGAGPTHADERGAEHARDHEHPHVQAEGHPRPSEPSRGVAVDVGDGRGALILYAGPEREWAEPEIHPIDEPARRQHVWVLERLVGVGSVYAAVFPSLPEGTYGICSPEGETTQQVDVVSGQVTTARWC